MLEFPYGIADFRRIRRDAMVYVDRTAHIRDLTVQKAVEAGELVKVHQPWAHYDRETWLREAVSPSEGARMFARFLRKHATVDRLERIVDRSFGSDPQRYRQAGEAGAEGQKPECSIHPHLQRWCCARTDR